MSLTTYSQFYFGHVIDTSNRYIDFKEGATTFVATIPLGAYTLTKLLEVLATAMNDQGANTYSFSVNRTTRIITLTSNASFDLLGATGANASQSVLSLIGFAAVDSLAITSKTGTTASGSVYQPQFTLQDHLATINNKKALSASVTKSASGNKVSVQSFGEERFLKINIKFITEIYQKTGKIKYDASALTNIRTFLDYCIQKNPIEYMADLSTPTTYEKVILESTNQGQDGTSYELKEYYDKGLPNYFETGTLTFKVITE